MDGHDDPARDHYWWYNDDGGNPAGEAPAVNATDAEDNFLSMFGNSTEDLFKLVWVGDTAGQPAVSTTIPTPELPRVPLKLPPSDEMMAAWLYPIVSGEVDHAEHSARIPADEVKREPSTMATVSLGTESKGKLLATEDMSPANNNENTGSGSSDRRKAASGGSSRTRSSQHSLTHNSTERRRRCKISDRLRTLQQLVPGCDKSNQASTLEQTIQYMKSLQQQVQSINMSPSASAARAMYPVMQPPPTAAVAMPILPTPTGQVRPGTVVPMVPYGSMIPYAQYHAVMMPAAASSAMPVMMPAPATATSTAPEGQCSISTERRHKKEKGKRRL